MSSIVSSTDSGGMPLLFTQLASSTGNWVSARPEFSRSICIAAGAGVIIGIRGLEYFTSPVDTRYIAFGLKDDLGGLAVGDPVRIGGYKVGQVDKIELVNPDDPRVEKSGGKPTTPILLVSISVPKKYVIKQGVIPAVQTSITGTSNINFDSLGTGDPLPVMQFMVGKPSAMSELLAMASDLKPRISSIMTQVDEKTIPAVTGVFADARTQTLPRANATFDEFKAAGTSAKTTLSKIEGHVDHSRSFSPYVSGTGTRGNPHTAAPCCR